MSLEVLLNEIWMFCLPTLLSSLTPRPGSPHEADLGRRITKGAFVCVLCCARRMIPKSLFTVELFDLSRVPVGVVLLFLLDGSDSPAFGINHPVCSSGWLHLVSFGMLRGWKGFWVWDDQSLSDSGLLVQDSSCLKSCTTLCHARSCPFPPPEPGTGQNLPAGLSDVTLECLHLAHFI